MNEQDDTSGGAELPPLLLKRREERRLRGGHLWVFSNEVDIASTPLRGFAPGDPVRIMTARDKMVGYGYVNPRSLICARILSRNPAQPPGDAFLRRRLAAALALRERLYDKPCYRLVHGESDGLPGLVIDRYGDVLIGQISTAGMERYMDAIAAACQTLLSPSAMLWQNDISVRDLEGLDRYVRPAFGTMPESLTIEEHGASFHVPAQGGQKTGWYYDQRDNRGRLASYVRGLRVLDVFAYVGGWGIQAARAGASEVLCVDSSGPALEQLRANAQANQVEVETLKADAFDALKQLREEGRTFDVVLLDPPAFVKRRKDLDRGKEAYRRLNQHGVRLLGDDGILISNSCSWHFPESELIKAVQIGAQRQEREVQLLEIRGQSADHPVHPAIPETRYLKTLVCRITRA